VQWFRQIQADRMIVLYAGGDGDFGLQRISAYNGRMPLHVDAVYENGVLRPLQPLDLREHEHVLVSVVKAAQGSSNLAVEYIESVKRQLREAEPAPGIEEVRRRLTKIPGSMAAEIVADRGERWSLAGHFFDSSALVKLYHPEVGTPAVDQIVNATDNLVRVSRLTVAELTSAFAIKVRTQSMSRDDADVFLRQFRSDIATGKLEVFSIGESEFTTAELLVERYAFDSRLRALDALQLAVALELRNHKLVDHFVAADAILCEVARL
jgi:uncharacterized protein